MVELRDLAELEVVHKALMAARFAESPSDPVLLASPYLAIVHSSIIDEIVAAYRRDGKEGIAVRWEQWRKLSKDRREWFVVKERLSSPEMGWAHLGGEGAKRDLLGSCLEPFTVSPELFDDLIDELNQETNAL